MLESLESRRLFAATPAALAEPAPAPTLSLNYTKIKFDLAKVVLTDLLVSSKVSMQDFHFTSKVSQQDFHFVMKIDKATPK